jgi:protein TonB
VKRFDILLKEPALSKERAERYKDFDGLMARHQHRQLLNRKKKAYKIMISGLAFLLVISGLWLIPENKPATKALPAHEQAKELMAQEQPVDAPRPADEGKPAGPELPAEQNEGQQAARKTVAQPAKNEAQGSPGRKKKDREQNQPVIANTKKESSDDEQALVYSEATPREGMQKLHEYFNTNLVYPEEELLAEKEGTVILSFIINTGGKAEEIRVVHAVSPGIDQEAIRLIREMPAWKPAHVNGSPVISRVNIPVTFKLTDYEKY